MKIRFGRRAQRVVLVAAVLFVLAAGIAYATIPDGGQVYTACMLKNVGTIRLIDPSLGSSTLLGHCTSLESQLTWNQQGQRGLPGTSPTVTQLAVNDANCHTGGAAITDAAGSTAYVCNGAPGAKGEKGDPGTPFSGQFTSDNGEYSITVADTGIVVRANGTQIHLAGDDVTVMAGDHLALRAGSDATLDGGSTATVTSNGTTDIVGSTTNVTGGGTTHVSAGGVLGLSGAIVQLNGSGCKPAARITDSVTGTAPAGGGLLSGGEITGGSPTVCIGG